MDYISFLYGLKREGIKLGLDIMKSFSQNLGNPQDSYRNVHVAGTNGKGTTAALVYNMLNEKYRTGLYTSPHLIDFNERVLFQKEFIDDGYIRQFVSDNFELIRELALTNRNPTFFETTTAMAFRYFADRDAEFASIEVGLGGRLDSTNILNPEVSVITSVGYEHADRLGTSLDSIAFEKGGIIKQGRPVVLGDTKKEVVSVIRKLSALRGSELKCVGSDSTFSDLEIGPEGTSFNLSTEKAEYRIKSRMIGRFQQYNIAAAVLAGELLEDYGMGKSQILKGVENTIWPARMEAVSRDPFVVVDAAHNPPAAHALASSYSALFKEKPHLVVGMLKDKDFYSFLKVMSEISDSITLTTPDEPQRSLPPQKLASTARKYFRDVEIVEDPVEAYSKARQNRKNILVTGSIYLVGIIKKLEHSPVIPYLN